MKYGISINPRSWRRRKCCNKEGCLILLSNGTSLGGYRITGIGFPGETLTSSRVGQWYVNGVLIPGQTGNTYIVSYYDVGKSIRQGNSNTILIFTPLDLPSVNGWYHPDDVLNNSAQLCAWIDAVATWPDRSQYGYHAIQTTAGLRPISLPCRSGDLHYLHLPGVTGNYASIPDASALDITGDITIDCQLTMADWTPVSEFSIINKWSTIGTAQRSYYLGLRADGSLVFAYSSNGSAIISIISTIATGITDGATRWIRLIFDVDNGSSGNTARFYTSIDGSAWTQLGAPIVTGGIASIFSGSSSLFIGQNGDTSAPATRVVKLYNVKIYADIMQLDKRFDSDFTNITHGVSSFACVTGQTVTINISGTNPALLVGISVVRFDGVDDLMSLPSSTFANFKSKSFGYIFAGSSGNQLTGGGVSQCIMFYSSGSTTGSTRIGILTRVASSNTFAAGARETDAGSLIFAASASSVGSKVLTAEALWGTAIRLRIDGSQTATTSLTAQSSATDSLAASIGGAVSLYSACDISNIITSAPASSWTAAQRSQAERYIGLPLGKNIPLQ